MFALQNSSSSKSLGFCASPFRGFFAFGCTLIGNSDARIAKAAVTQAVSRARELGPKALQDMVVPDAVRLEIEDRLKTLPLAGTAKP